MDYFTNDQKLLDAPHKDKRRVPNVVGFGPAGGVFLPAPSTIFASSLNALGEEERCAYPDYPLWGTIGTLQKVVSADLQTQSLRAQLEGSTDVRAHGNSPCVAGLGCPIVRNRRFALDVPAAFEVVANVGLQESLINAAAVAIPGKRHELVREDAVEPRTLGVDEGRCWSRRPSAGPERVTGRRWKLKDRPRAPDPGGRVGRREKKGSLQVLQSELFMGTREVSDVGSLCDQFPLPTTNGDFRSVGITTPETAGTRRSNRDLNEVLKRIVDVFASS